MGRRPKLSRDPVGHEDSGSRISLVQVYSSVQAACGTVNLQMTFWVLRESKYICEYEDASSAFWPFFSPFCFWFTSFFSRRGRSRRQGRIFLRLHCSRSS